MTSDEIMRMPDTQSLLVFSNQRPIKATKAFQFKLFPGADHLIQLAQNDYHGEMSMTQQDRIKRANEKWEAEIEKTEEINQKNDVKPEEEEDLQDEMDSAIAKQQTSSEDKDFDLD